jgi:hypothetical protein
MRLIIVLLSVVLVALLGWQAYPRLAGIYPLKPWDQPQELVSRRIPATEKTVDVLFIGNSFTSTHAMPAMLVNLASSDPANPVRLRVWTVTRGGATLAHHRAEGRAARLLASRSFDYVVLNQQSSWAYYPPWVSETRADVAYWSGLIRSRGAEPVLMETWADGAGSQVHAAGGWLHNVTPAMCQEKISEETADLARAQSLAVAPVGQSFRRAGRYAPAQNLLAADQHHPSVSGAYLSAATFYRFFTGRSAAQSSYRPPGLTEAEATQLAEIPSQ